MNPLEFSLINYYKYDPFKDGERNFSIAEALNENWEHSATLILELRNAVINLLSELGTKVPAELGKGLSTHDFTQEYIDKINSFDISVISKFDELEQEQKRLSGIVNSYTRDLTVLIFKLTTKEWIDTEGIDHVVVDRMDTPDAMKLISGYHSTERKEIYI